MPRIRLRPYHPTYIVAHYGGGVPEDSRARPGFEAIQRKIRESPLEEIEIEIVRDHDDACEGCRYRREKAGGSVWASALVASRTMASVAMATAPTAIAGAAAPLVSIARPVLVRIVDIKHPASDIGPHTR